MLLLTGQSMLRALQRHAGNPVHIILRSASLYGTKPRKVLRRAIYLSSKGRTLSFWNQHKSWLCDFRSSSSCLCGRRYYSDMKDDEQVKSWLSEIQRDFDKHKSRKQNHAAQNISDRDEHILNTAAENDDENLDTRKKSEADNGSDETDVHGFTVDEMIEIIKQSQNNENVEAGSEKSGGSDLENVSDSGTSSDSDSSTSSDSDSSSESEDETIDNTNISGGKININTDKKASKNNASLTDLGIGLEQTDIHKASSRMTVELNKLMKRKPVILIDEVESKNELDERTPVTTGDKDDGANAVKVKKRKPILISDDDELLDLSERGRPVVKVDKNKFEKVLKRKHVFVIDEDELVNVSNERTPDEKLDKFDSLSESSADGANDSKPASERSSDEEADTMGSGKSGNEEEDILGSKGTDKDEIEDFSNIDFQVSEEAVREWEPPVALTRGLTGVYDIEDLVKVLESCRARDIVVIKIPDELDYAHYMVIVTCLSLRHIKAVAHDVRWIFKRKKHKTDKMFRIEGEDTTDWFAMDLGNIILHVFTQSTREYYNLENQMLWTVGPKHLTVCMLGNIILHVFTQSTREYYDLETLWTVGPKYDPKCQEEVVTEQLYSLSDLPWLEELEQAEGIVKASSNLKSNTDFQHSPK